MGIQEDTIVYLFPKKSSKRKSNKPKTSRSPSPVRVSRTTKVTRTNRSPSPKRKEQLNLFVVKY
jgi:hypothetical protein